ncbi:MAG TPA: YncE family protein [Candidatus Acidoferrales bacterium]|nr:YncE family protein [Candidatus Acidoferrales bacterium]
MKPLRFFAALAAAIFLTGAAAAAPAGSPLTLVAKYKMPAAVKGRFDHLGIDLRGNRLFLAAETYHAVLVFNLHTGKFERAITGIQIPHAIFCRQDINRLYITDGGAGELKIYDGKTYRLLKAVKLKVDADSIGYDPATRDLYIDDGGGDAHEPFSMLSVVNTSSGEKVADMQIDGDTLEAMALEPSGSRMFVNNRAKNQIAVVDRKTHQLIASWPVTMGRFNVAIALDPASHRLFVGCRGGELVVFDTETGKELQALPIAKGVDDLVFDPATKRIYATCGAAPGEIDVYQEQDPDRYESLGRVPSAPGAKNQALAAGLARLFVTVPPQGDAPGEVYVYRTR